jgi:hypothetical protein
VQTYPPPRRTATDGFLQQANYDPLIRHKRLDIEFLLAIKFFGKTLFGLREGVVHQRLRDSERTEDDNFYRRVAN